jgi:hypothetical protein
MCLCSKDFPSEVKNDWARNGMVHLICRWLQTIYGIWWHLPSMLEWSSVNSKSGVVDFGHSSACLGLFASLWSVQYFYESNFETECLLGDIVDLGIIYSFAWWLSFAGKLKAVDDKWVEVTFNAPTVELGPFRTQYGGNSTVKLAVIYLDNVVRIGRGSRGSLFIFKRRN